MKLTIGDYKIESDSNCFSLLAKKIVQPIVKDGEIVNKENVGSERWVVVGYYSQVDSLLNAIPRQVLLDNDDLLSIKQKLEVINIQIAGIRRVLEECINE